MSKTTLFLLFLIVLGSIFFRDLFQWIWLGIGGLFIIFLVIFHISESKREKNGYKINRRG
jgi:hypothetical protein